MGICWSSYKQSALKRRLRTCELKTTPRFVPEFKYAKVVKVYDGDTVTLAAIPFGSKKPYLFQCRLTRIDAPEMTKQSGKTQKARNREKALAIKSRDALFKLIGNKVVKVDIKSLEKYGRVLADLTIDNTDVSDWMIQHKYAVPYSGGKKCKW